jgi:hypothetical protein
MKKTIIYAVSFFVGALLGGFAGVTFFNCMLHPVIKYRAIDADNNYLVTEGNFGYVPGDSILIDHDLKINPLCENGLQAVIIEIINP